MPGEWRSQLEQLMDVVLRVPPLYVLNSILNETFLSAWPWTWIPGGAEPEPEAEAEADGFFSFTMLIRLSLIFIALVGSVVILTLGRKWLLQTYCFLLASGVIMLSYWFNSNYIMERSALEDSGTLSETGSQNTLNSLMNATFQLVLAFCYNSLRLDLPFKDFHTDQSIFMILSLFQALVYMCFLQPVLLHDFVGCPAELLERVPQLSLLLLGSEFILRILMLIKPIIKIFKDVFQMGKYILKNYGIQTFLEHEWVRLHVPAVLKLFYVSRLAYHIIGVIFLQQVSIANEDDADNTTQTSANNSMDSDEPSSGGTVLQYVQYLLTYGCDTFISLLGMTSVVSYLAHIVGLAAAAYIGSNSEEDKNLGTVAAILFLILSLQTGLTGMRPERRLNRLYKNCCLLLTAVLHFIHSMIYPLLLNLGASHSASRLKHARLLSMCFMLLVFPCTFCCYLWMHHMVNTWLLAVTAFSIEVVIKVLITLTIYGLFIIDAYRQTFWEKLDDYVYYVKSTGNTIEFLFGIFLFCNGAWIFMFESGGAIRAVMMCIHAYFNIWVQAQEGWKVFIKRRTAVRKINSLPMATQQQIEQHNDVCAICYQELDSARITRCQHLFHSMCLRKWLYIQDKCPMCHTLMYQVEGQEEQLVDDPNDLPRDVDHHHEDDDDDDDDEDDEDDDDNDD